MTINLTDIILALITLLGGIVVRYVVPFIQSKLTDKNYAFFVEAVNIAVYAAEQIYKGAGRGAEKLEYVKNLLAEQGYNIDDDAVIAAIEAQVQALNIALKG